MRILIAPDKFKDSLDAVAVAEAMAAGVRDARPDASIALCPMSDGGEGFVAVILRACGGTTVTQRVVGPLPERHVDATFGLIDNGRTAVIEMSSASGIALLPTADRNPLYTTTFGTGELMHRAAELGCRKILLGIGGSATCDAGIGCLQACGCHITMSDHQYATAGEPLCARDLGEVVRVKSHRGSPVDGVEITIACDVTNPLHGPNGSAFVYAPQKGASPDDVRELDRLLASFAVRQGWQRHAQMPGAGAAGGIGFGLAAMFNAALVRGIDLIADATRLDARIASADLVLTGEGRLDAQSASGKAVAGIAGRCRAVGKPCWAIVGGLDAAFDPQSIGLRGATSLVDDATPLEVAMRDAASLILERTRRVVMASIR